MARSLLAFSLLVLAVLSGQAQTHSLKFPIKVKLPEKFQKAIKERTKEYDRLFYRDSAASKHYPVSFILHKIDNVSSYSHIFLAEYWIAFHYGDIIPELIKRVTNKKEIGLTNSADLIIWERAQAKQMQSYGHGGISNDDLFTIAGRANRLLTVITGENFGHVSMYSTQDRLIPCCLCRLQSGAQSLNDPF